jgi:hypothetical protein
VFDEYLGLVEARIDALREAGKLDVGVETIIAERMTEIERHLLRRDSDSGAETHLLRLEMHFRPRILSFERMMATSGERRGVRWLQNARSQMVAASVPGVSVMADDGAVLPVEHLVRPTKTERIKRSALEESNWVEINHEQFEALWHAEAAAAAERMEVETINIATGLLLPIWNKLPRDHVRVWRIADKTGQSWLGRIVPDADLGELSTKLGIAIKIDVDPEALLKAAFVQHRKVDLPGTEMSIWPSLVNGSRRIELKGFAPERLDWYKSLGGFTEIISYKTRLFLPPETAARIIAVLTVTTAEIKAAA